MRIQYNASLKPYNTFGLDVRAGVMVEVNNEEELFQALALPYTKVRILGGGSNVLLVNDLDGLVLVNRIRGKEILRRNEEEAVVRLGGGENWHEVVLWSIEQELGGLENLSLIPGTVGAAPIQNIGAYGVELGDVFESLEAIDLRTRQLRIFRAEDCEFGYRDSIFKRDYFRNCFLIVRVNLRLRYPPHQLNTSYGAIRSVLEEMGAEKPGIRELSQAVIRIRRSKLPDPAELGNSGSFFKNPVISRQQFDDLRERFPDIIGYDLPEEEVKVPAGWLIEACGWKGKKVGNTGSHAKQSLVLVNYGGASGREVLDLARAIQASVSDTFGIELTPEVNIWE